MRRLLSAWMGTGLVVALLALPTLAQDVRASLFTEIDGLLEQALALRADILAPKSFGEFQKLYDRASDNLERGQQIEKIRSDLTKASGFLEKAIDATTLADVTFPSVMDARDDAELADSAGYAATLWVDAEKQFSGAATALENGDVKSAKKRAADAEKVYREAELNAIKTNYFQETRDLLAQADRDKIAKFAPKTLQRSKDLLSEAERLLEESRYDTDTPRTLARQAKYEVKHAVNMAALLARLDNKELTQEDLVLQVEAAITSVAGELDVLPRFDEGYGLTTESVLEQLEVRNRAQRMLEGDLADYGTMTEGLEAQIAALQSELGGVSQERAAIEARMAAEAEVRGQFAQVESMFSSQEAAVYRQQNDLLIRMVGLNFQVGSSTIEPKYFALLTKVQNAIKTFPGCRITVEGHTDSLGSDEVNLKVSEERAAAVREYLLANMDIPASRIDAVGYGESKPIASNETDEGQTKNRRIDLVIEPNLKH